MVSEAAFDGHHADTFFAVYTLSGGKAHTEIHTVTWKGAASSRVRLTGGVLPEGRFPFHGQPWSAGEDRHPGGGGAASVEKTDAPVHCRGNGLLSAAAVLRVLRGRA